MRSRALPLLLLPALLAACGQSGEPDWPPYHTQLEALFERSHDALVELEATMAEDSIPRMSASIVTGDVIAPGMPKLDLDQTRKYRDLLNRAEVGMTVVRGPDSTQFEMLSEAVGTQLYVFRFVHRHAGEFPEDCDSPVHNLACGTCDIALDDDWSLEYEWFPQNLDEEAEQCAP